MRDVFKQAEHGEKVIKENERYGMDLSEINQMLSVYDNSDIPYSLIELAFNFGVSVGYRIGKAKK